MKRALLIRNVSSHDVPLDSLDNACVHACTAQGFITELAVNHEADIMHQLMQTHARAHSTSSYSPGPFDAVLFRASGLSEQRLYPLLRTIRTISKQIFLCVFSPQLADHPMGRYQCFQQGASMVTDSLDAVRDVLAFIASCGEGYDPHSRRKSRGRSGGRDGFTCPFCGKSGMDEDQLWRHCPMYHINEKNTDGITCPICRETPRGPFQVHMHNAHGPPGRREMASEFNMADSTLYSFALVVCHNKKYNSFLLVQEFANSGFWLPGGRIDSGENPAQAAIRETKEEAGIDIRLTGLLKLEYHPKQDRNGSQYVRMRFIFYAEPLDCDQPPKSIPDYESAGATWCRADQVDSLPLRGSEPITYFNHIASGKPIYPLDLVHMTSSST
ncbi:hypothetical protein PR003_g1506 [Phytophthora rubi]|uniref:Nudix hydrolase domain-containing protein n=1 Tax=Phytophthora rubi TaxID=129364 RepID=A0A6A3P7Z7_9STRA|nr:hypothetical protein PR001_g1090 [Phytophthora rubi]KAE9357992.1 hypothetical protein PR003_g1506 [Phytophthora rubi]